MPRTQLIWVGSQDVLGRDFFEGRGLFMFTALNLSTACGSDTDWQNRRVIVQSDIAGLSCSIPFRDAKTLRPRRRTRLGLEETRQVSNRLRYVTGIASDRSASSMGVSSPTQPTALDGETACRGVMTR